MSAPSTCRTGSSDENAPLTWRLDKSKSGSGSLGDIGAHSIDAAQWITGQKITGVSALLETFVKERPLAGDLVGLGGHGAVGAGRTARDRSPWMTPPSSAPGSTAALLERRGRLPRAPSASSKPPASRWDGRTPCAWNSTAPKASLAFDFEDMNVLSFYDAAESPDAGFRRIFVTEPEHPYAGNWWPTGHGLGYEHGFTHQVVDLVDALAQARSPTPSFADALQVQRVLAAVEASAARLQPMAESLRTMTAEQGNAMTRPITLFTGQWADLPFEEVARLAGEWGFDGLEIACWGDHLDPRRRRRRRFLCPGTRWTSLRRTTSKSSPSPTT